MVFKHNITTNNNKSLRLSGFTLIEIVVAMGLVVIGMMSIFALFPVGMNSAKKATDQAVLATLVEQKFSDIMYNRDASLNYNVTADSGSFPTGTPDPEPFTETVDITSTWTQTRNLKYYWHYYVNEHTFTLQTAPTLIVVNVRRVDLLIYGEEDKNNPLDRIVTFMTTKTGA